MTIPRFTIPYIFWRPNKVYGIHKVCITGGTLLLGEYLKGNSPPNYPMPAIPHHVTIQHDYVAIYGKYMVSFACWHKLDPYEYLNEWPSYYD